MKRTESRKRKRKGPVFLHCQLVFKGWEWDCLTWKARKKEKKRFLKNPMLRRLLISLENRLGRLLKDWSLSQPHLSLMILPRMHLRMIGLSSLRSLLVLRYIILPFLFVSFQLRFSMVYDLLLRFRVVRTEEGFFCWFTWHSLFPRSYQEDNF